MLDGLEFSRQLKQGPYAHSYPRFLYLTDGALCFACARKEAALIRLAAMTKDDNGWRPYAFDVNWESDILCDNCNKRIEAAYILREEFEARDHANAAVSEGAAEFWPRNQRADWHQTD